MLGILGKITTCCDVLSLLCRADMTNAMKGWSARQVSDALLCAKRWHSVDAVMSPPETVTARQAGPKEPHPGRAKPPESQKGDLIKRAREIEGETSHFICSFWAIPGNVKDRFTEVAARINTGRVGG